LRTGVAIGNIQKVSAYWESTAKLILGKSGISYTNPSIPFLLIIPYLCPFLFHNSKRTSLHGLKWRK